MAGSLRALSPAALLLMASSGTAAAEVPRVCEFSFQILPMQYPSHNTLRIPAETSIFMP